MHCGNQALVFLAAPGFWERTVLRFPHVDEPGNSKWIVPGSFHVSFPTDRSDHQFVFGAAESWGFRDSSTGQRGRGAAPGPVLGVHKDFPGFAEGSLNSWTLKGFRRTGVAGGRTKGLSTWLINLADSPPGSAY